MLKGKCFFPLLKLINKLEIKEDLKGLAKNVGGKTEEEKNNIAQNVGIDFVFLLAKKLGNAEKETWDFMTLYLEKSLEEVQEMDILEIAEKLKELFMDKRFQDFFQQAMK